MSLTAKVQDEMLEDLAWSVLMALEEVGEGEAMEPCIAEVHRFLFDHLEIDFECQTDLGEVNGLGLISGLGI